PAASVLAVIEPVQPPFPLASKLPFQPDSGSQISILISESADGFEVIATRQCAGTSPPPPPLPLPCPCSGPAGTLCARVTVAFVSLSDVRLSHVAAMAYDATRIRPASFNMDLTASFGIKVA